MMALQPAVCTARQESTWIRISKLRSWEVIRRAIPSEVSTAGFGDCKHQLFHHGRRSIRRRTV